MKAMEEGTHLSAQRSRGTWSGDYVARELGVRIHTDPASAVAIEDLVGLALRQNPKRAHLLVSRVLAKHVPTEPALVMAAGKLLGAFIAAELITLNSQEYADSDRGQPEHVTALAAQLTAALQLPPGQRHHAIAVLESGLAQLSTAVPEALVIGYAETATGLGRLVANALSAYYIHSTRHATPGIAPVAGFEEGHSHATSHAMVPASLHWLDGEGPVVLVDDEFSTGSTVINTIRELHAMVAHRVYVVAALIDLRSTEDKDRFAALAKELGCHIRVTALGTGRIDLGDNVLGRAAGLIARLPRQESVAQPAGRLTVLDLSTTDAVAIRSDRFGNADAPDQDNIAVIAQHVAAHLQAHHCQGALAVVGCEENMFLPLAVARALESLLPQMQVRFSTTTRSPIVPVDTPGYAITGALSFASHDLSNDGPGMRFAYNLSAPDQRPGTIVVFPEPGTDSGSVLHSSVSGLSSLGAAMASTAEHAVVVLLAADTPEPTPAPSPEGGPL